MSSTAQEHSLRPYWIMWGALFILSAFSYATDFMEHGTLRTLLIVTLMMLKATGIVWIFMHMGGERLALKVAILVPPVALLVLVWLMAYEGDYTFLTRIVFFGEGAPATPMIHH